MSATVRQCLPLFANDDHLDPAHLFGPLDIYSCATIVVAQE